MHAYIYCMLHRQLNFHLLQNEIITKFKSSCKIDKLRISPARRLLCEWEGSLPAKVERNEIILLALLATLISINQSIDNQSAKWKISIFPD